MIHLNGSDYRIRPLRLSDFAEFERWVEDEPLRRAARNLQTVPSDMRGELLQAAQKEISQERHLGNRNPGQIADILLHRQQRVASCMMSVEGTIQILWLSLRAEQPDLTAEDIADKVGLDTLPYIHEKLDEMNGFSNPSPARATRKGPSRPKKGR